MSSFPYDIPHSFRRFVRLSPQRGDGISKWTGRYVKLDLLTFILQACNWCTETFAVNCILDLPLSFYFLLQIPPAPPFFQMVFSVTLSLTQMRRHAVLLYPEQGAEGAHGTLTYTNHSVELTRHTVSAAHYCEDGFSLFFNCDIRPIIFHYWPRICVHIDLCFWC